MSAFWFFYIVSALFLLVIVVYDTWFTIVRLGEPVHPMPTAVLALVACTPYANAAAALIFVTYWLVYSVIVNHRVWFGK